MGKFSSERDCPPLSPPHFRSAIFAQRARVLLARHQTSGIDIDLAFGLFPFESEAIAQAMIHEVGGIRVPLPLPEDLVIMKAIAHRPRDMVDIESILAAQPKLDLRRVRRLVRELATRWRNRTCYETSTPSSRGKPEGKSGGDGRCN